MMSVKMLSAYSIFSLKRQLHYCRVLCITFKQPIDLILATLDIIVNNKNHIHDKS